MATTTLEAPQTATQTAVETSWHIDAMHSSAHFSVKHMMISNVRGVFKNLESKLFLNSEDISKSYLEASIPTSTVSTGVDDRDAHLRSADFFEAEKFPAMKFISKKFEQVAPGELKVTGLLTIKDVTKEVVLDVEGPTPEMKDPYGFTRVALSGSTKINRKDFGLVYNAVLEAGGVMVGEDVKITIDAEYTKVEATEHQQN